MQKTTRRWLGIGTIALALPLAATAQEAFTRGAVNLRAGPSSTYPLVATLAPGQPVQVMGCTGGYGWCDIVLSDGLRGWAYAGSLDYAYQEQRVPLATYGAVIGVPIVTFAIGSYWGDYYRDRPWYSQPRWWGGRPPPPPVPGWRPLPPPVPAWRPNPWPGAGPHPGYRPPPPGMRPPAPAFHPATPAGIRPPHDPGFRPPGPPPGNGFQAGGRPPGQPHGGGERGGGQGQGGNGGDRGGDHGQGRGHGGNGGDHGQGRGHGGGGGEGGQGRGHGDHQ